MSFSKPMVLILGFLFGPVISTAAVSLVQEGFDLPVDSVNGKDIALEGRIDRPAGPGKWPVVIMSSGSGPSDVDFVMDAPNYSPELCLRYQGEPIAGGKCRWRFYQSTAQTLAAQGLAIVRLGKRGVRLDENKNPLPPDMPQHGTSTLRHRTQDLERLVTYLSATQPELDMNSFYLYGFSEGTVVSTMYARQHPSQVKGMVLIGSVLDSLKEIFHDQTVTVQWPQLLRRVDEDKNGVITPSEFNLTVLAKPDYTNMGAPSFADRIKNYQMMGKNVDFNYFDLNQDGKIEQRELIERLEQDIWQPLLAAIDAGNQEEFKKYDPDVGVNSFEQVKEWFSLGRIGDELIEASVPVSIFIGDHDLNTPASQLDWFVPLIKERGKQDLFHVEVVGDAHVGPHLVDAAARRIKDLKWGRF